MDPLGPVEVVFDKDGAAFLVCPVDDVEDPFGFWENCGFGLCSYDDPIDVGEPREGREVWELESVLKKRLEGNEFYLCVGAME